MPYDIGVGICAAIDRSQVVIKLDSAMVSLFLPGTAWRRSGTSLLYVDPRLCSERMPPEVGREAYLSRERIDARATASLDVNGDGVRCAVDLRRLLGDVEPGPAPRAAPRARRR